jgi:hypothetical protein
VSIVQRKPIDLGLGHSFGLSKNASLVKMFFHMPGVSRSSTKLRIGEALTIPAMALNQARGLFGAVMHESGGEPDFLR